MARILQTQGPINFDPNAEGYGLPEFATFIPGRKPNFKLHTDRGKALSACGYHRYGFILYTWDAFARRWTEIERRDPSVNSYLKCSCCDTPFKQGAFDPDPRCGWIGTPHLRFIALCFDCNVWFGKLGIWKAPLDKRWMPDSP